MSLKVYFDLMSQPARAVLLFCKINKIPFTPKPIALTKLEHHTEEYANINPFKKIPAIQDGDFKLTESVAILQYLAVKYNCPEHWYPRDIQARSKIRAYMAWQHLNVRSHCSVVFLHEVILPMMKGRPVDTEKLSKHVDTMNTTLTSMEEIFLKDQEYLCGNAISIADLLGVCEVEQPKASGRDVTEGHPKLRAWVNRVKADLGPHYDEVFAAISKMGAANKARRARL